MNAKPVTLQEISTNLPAGAKLIDGNFELIKNLKVRVAAHVGEAELSVAELFDLKEDSVVELGSATNDPINIVLDGKVIARGALVVVGDHFGIRVTEILRESAQ